MSIAIRILERRLRCQLVDRLGVPAAAGTHDTDVDATKMLECGLDQVPEPIGSEDVGRCGDGLPVVTFDVLDDGVGTLIARSVVDDDLGAFACQR